MASLSTDANGNRTLQFVSGDGKRRTIRLGKLPKKEAETIKLRVEALNAANISQHAPRPRDGRLGRGASATSCTRNSPPWV